MTELRRDRLGSALRQMAEDLVAARQRGLVLQRENAKLRERLAALERSRAAHREGVACAAEPRAAQATRPDPTG